MAQAVLIQFTTHAAERMQSRLGIRIHQGQTVDITNNFIMTHEYRHIKTGRVIQHWCNRDQTQPVVMAVEADTGFVVTVMTNGEIVDREYSRLNARH